METGMNFTKDLMQNNRVEITSILGNDLIKAGKKNEEYLRLNPIIKKTFQHQKNELEEISQKIPKKRSYSFDELKVKTQKQIDTLSIKNFPYHSQSCLFANIKSPRHSNVEIEGRSNQYYFHGNTISYKHNEIIAAQYPIKNFWEEFWKITQRCSLIVDLTNDNDAKGAPYAPLLGETKTFDNLSVKCTSEEKLSEHMMLFTYVIPFEGQTCELTRLHYTGWPDGGCVSVEELERLINTIKLYQRMDEEKSKLSKPIFMHCLGGIGRTGTVASVIEMDAQIKKNKDDEKITRENSKQKTFEVVLKGRECRGRHFVHKEAQFNLINQYVDRQLSNN